MIGGKPNRADFRLESRGKISTCQRSLGRKILPLLSDIDSRSYNNARNIVYYHQVRGLDIRASSCIITFVDPQSMHENRLCFIANQPCDGLIRCALSCDTPISFCGFAINSLSLSLIVGSARILRSI